MILIVVFIITIVPTGTSSLTWWACSAFTSNGKVLSGSALWSFACLTVRGWSGESWAVVTPAVRSKVFGSVTLASNFSAAKSLVNLLWSWDRLIWWALDTLGVIQWLEHSIWAFWNTVSVHVDFVLNIRFVSLLLAIWWWLAALISVSNWECSNIALLASTFPGEDLSFTALGHFA